jgi:hypothetical protein
MCFYSQTFRQWIALGVNTNDIFLIGDEGLLTKKSTGIAHKYVHGVESANNKLLFFEIDDFTSNPITYDRCAANDYTSWSTVTIDVGPYNHAEVIDSVVLPNGHIMLVGGTGNTNRFRSWTSTDHGDTWSTSEVGVPFSGTQYLSGISVGKNARVFTWAYLTAGANLGDRLWYSDDEGTTWTQTSAIAHGLIRDVIYVSGFDRYLVLTDFGHALTTDPTDPALYDWNTSVVIRAAVTDGGNIVYSDVSNVSINEMKFSMDMMTSSALMHRSPNAVYCVAFGGVTGQNRQFATLSTYDFPAADCASYASVAAGHIPRRTTIPRSRYVVQWRPACSTRFTAARTMAGRGFVGSSGRRASMPRRRTCSRRDGSVQRDDEGRSRRASDARSRSTHHGSRTGGRARRSDSGRPSWSMFNTDQAGKQP